MTDLEKDNVKSLLATIGFTTREVCESDHLGNFSFQNGILLIDAKTGIYAYGAFWFESWEQLLHSIFTSNYLYLWATDSTKSNSSYVYQDNPYLGCSSIEEALVRKDLLGNG